VTTSDVSRPSCGQGFTEKSQGYTDLSALANDGFPAYGMSMQGGNTRTDTSDINPFVAPGSASEGTADIPAHDHPGLSVPAPYVDSTKMSHGDHTGDH
jgi:hypothetical protein